ncbi:MAG: DUF4012 domain-containing protein [Patescibacteria group bacterium]
MKNILSLIKIITPHKKHGSSRNIKAIIFFAALALLLAQLHSLWFGRLTLIALKARSFDQAANYAQSAKIFPQLLNTVTFGKIPDLEIISTSFSLVNKLPKIINYLNPISTDTVNDLDEKGLIDQTNLDLKKISEAYPKSILYGRLFPLHSISPDLITHASLLFDYLTSERLRVVIILQNSQEIRATGGFMGSYVDLSLQKGKLTQLDFHDIYQAEGLQASFVEPPSGVKKYLSDGDNWKLQDANWNPDFPSTAQQIQAFLADAKQPSSDLVIAINLEVVEQVLAVLGEVYLPDYQTKIDSHNFAEIARSQREDFFPGSHQKVNFLSAAFIAIKQKLVQTNSQQQLEIVGVLNQALKDKSIQAYSSNPKIQEIFKKRRVSGEMTFWPTVFSLYSDAIAPSIKPSEPIYFFAVESNVGINKANQKIWRDVEITIEQSQLTARIQFTNDNMPPTTKNTNPYLKQADHLGYVNYQRFFLNPDAKVRYITVDNQSVTSWEEKIVQIQNGQFFREVGFLLTIPEQQKNTVEILIDISSDKINPSQLVIPKQSGLPATNYTIRKGRQVINREITTDSTIMFETTEMPIP